MATELENLVPEADVEVEGMRGPKGEKGDSYVLTEADKEEIASKVDTIIDAETDKSLTISGKPADAKAAGDEINNLKADLNKMQTATSEDVGKALKAKTVDDGKVTEWEFGEAGGRNIYELNRHQLIDWTAEGVKENVVWYTEGSPSTISGTNCITDFIEVAPGDVLCLNYVGKYRFFDEAKNQMTAYNASGSNKMYDLGTVPEGAKYLKAQIPNASKENAFIYKYIGEYYAYSAYNDDVTSPYIGDNNTKAAMTDEINNGVKSGDIKLENANDGIFSLSVLADLDVFRWNCIDPNKILVGWGIDINTGKPIWQGTNGSSINYLSDFCKVDPGVTYRGTSATICGYDSNKTFIGKITAASNYTYIIPQDVYYIRVNIFTNRTDYLSMFKLNREGYGKTFGITEYYPYSNCFPMFKSEDAKTGFGLYLGLEPWLDKRIVTFGDSFSAPGTWQKAMCDNFHAISDNHSISGGGWCTGRTKTVYQLAQEVSEHPDIIIAALGVNDINNEMPLGEFINGTTVDDYSEATLYGGLQKALTYIRNTWTGVPVYIGFTPGSNAFVPSSRSELLKKFIDAMKDVCLAYSCIYIETRTCGMGYPLVQNDFVFHGNDGTTITDLHPSAKGQQQIARYMTDIMSGYRAPRSWYVLE